MKLRTKFAVALLLITVVLSVLTVAGLEYFKNQEVERVEADVDETATQTAEQIRTELADRRDYIGYVASRDAAADFDRSGQLLTGMLDNSRFRNALVVNDTGVVVDARGTYTPAERRELVGSSVSDGPCVEETLRTGDQCVSDPVAANDSHAVVISAPIFEAGNVTGALVGVIRITDQTFLSTLDPLETSAQAVVVTHEGTQLRAAHANFSSIITGEATVDRYGWTVRIERDSTALQRQLRQLALAQGVGLFVVLGTVVGFGYWEYSVNLRQTRQLLAGFRRVRRGEYTASLSLSSGEEWEQISDGFNDLTDGLAARERQLREREQRLEVLNRVMRHNVRNEMVVVLNYAELVEEMVDNDRIQQMARKMYDAGNELTALSDKARQIENVMGEDTHPRRLDLTGIVEDVVRETRDAYPDVTLDVTLPADTEDGDRDAGSPDSDADAATVATVSALPAIRRAVENVVENACKHNDSDEPTVEVTIAPTEEAPAGTTPDERSSPDEARSLPGGVPGTGGVRLSVIDDGPGIPEQEHAVLKEGRETALEHGSGLGLWLVYWVVDRSGGALDIRENDPRGSIVDIHLPAAAPDTSGGKGESEHENENENESEHERANERQHGGDETAADDESVGSDAEVGRE